jgi:hypothetical protein
MKRPLGGALGEDRSIILKWKLRCRVWCRKDSSDSGWGKVVSSCRHDMNLQVSEGREFFD